MRIGILGGSFDPVHHGHLGVARAVADALRLDRIWLMPAAQAPLRDGAVRATGPQRVDMLRLALQELAEREGERRLEVNETELQRGGTSYTVDTLRALHDASVGCSFTWIVGADQLARLAEWREPAELARLAEWAVYSRPGYDLTSLGASPVRDLRVHRVEPAAGSLWDLSSSQIRARLARGESIRGQTPDKVVEYIAEKGLYLGR
jgi:nicotinate-nucleotide adenylyltransferase